MTEQEFLALPIVRFDGSFKIIRLWEESFPESLRRYTHNIFGKRIARLEEETYSDAMATTHNQS